MKTLKLHRLAIACSLFLASCAETSYLGDYYPATTKIDFYYDAKDVKQDYKVIGHLTTSDDNSNRIKNILSKKGAPIGADGFIILEVVGHDDNKVVKADAIKYTAKDN